MLTVLIKQRYGNHEELVYAPRAKTLSKIKSADELLSHAVRKLYGKDCWFWQEVDLAPQGMFGQIYKRSSGSGGFKRVTGLVSVEVGGCPRWADVNSLFSKTVSKKGAKK